MSLDNYAIAQMLFAVALVIFIGATLCGYVLLSAAPDGPKAERTLRILRGPVVWVVVLFLLWGFGLWDNETTNAIIADREGLQTKIENVSMDTPVNPNTMQLIIDVNEWNTTLEKEQNRLHLPWSYLLLNDLEPLNLHIAEE